MVATRNRNTTPAAARCPWPGKVVLPVRVQHRVSRRQRVVGLVVIDDDDLRAGLVGGGDGVDRCSAAIDGEDETRAVSNQPCKRLRRRPIAFGEPVGDIGGGTVRMGAQEALDQRDRGRAVDVVVAEYGDRLAAR